MGAWAWTHEQRDVWTYRWMDGWMGNVSNNYISIIFLKQKSSNAFDEFAHDSTLQNLQQLLLILVS